VYRRINDVFSQLADNPRCGRLRNELRQNLRSFPVGQHLIFYTVVGDVAEVVRILHSARDLSEQF
jgi:toxin ParE1/3/4